MKDTASSGKAARFGVVPDDGLLFADEARLSQGAGHACSIRKYFAASWAMAPLKHIPHI